MVEIGRGRPPLAGMPHFITQSESVFHLGACDGFVTCVVTHFKTVAPVVREV